MRVPLLTFLLAAVALPLAAQSNAERILNDRYTRSHDYDLVHQRIEVGNFDWDSLTFDGRVATTLVALRDGLDSVVLDAGTLLDVTGVQTMPGRSRMPLRLRSDRHGDTLVVHLAGAARFGDTMRVDIVYRGRVENGRGLTFFKAEPGRPHRPQQIWSQGEDTNNHDWFPTYDFPNDKMTWELAATVPAAYTAVSNGRLVSDVRAGNRRTMTWSQERPSASYLVSLVVAPLVKVSDHWGAVPVDYYVYREDSALARPLFSVTPDMIDVYSRLTGVRYPWAKYAQTTVADFFGGMENVSATTLVDWLPDPRAYLDRPWYQHILIPHELAHQWFGDLVTTENWANMWLNEGFAEFMPGQYWAAKQGRHAEDDYYLDEYRQFMQIDARRRMPVAALGSNNIYPRGALVLEMLKKQLGERPFWAAIRRYLTQHAYGNAVTDDFRQAILDATGRNLDRFFDEWIYQAGYPEFAITDRYDAATRQLSLTVRQTQTDSALADSTGLRYTTPAVFHLPVTIRVGTAAGDVVRRAELDQREQTIVVDGVASEPTMVVFDDGNTILKRLVYDQPTPRLATQLAKDADLWNRQWIIDQLAERTADAAAGDALARTARESDYFLTRAAAAAGLARFPAAVALPALEVALGDSSAQVREAAAATLGAVVGAGDAGATLARRAWTHDPSYEVRASALRSLARLDPVGRRDLIRRGLGTPSYRESIQNAALGAVVQSGDSTLLPDVDALAGAQQFPLFALAAMAGRGSASAMALLVGHLNDDRAWVRRWAVEAFTNGMEPKMALERLTALAPSIRHTDTAAAARKAITRLGKAGEDR